MLVAPVIFASKATFKKRLASVMRNFVARECKSLGMMQVAFARRIDGVFPKATCIIRQRFPVLATYASRFGAFYLYEGNSHMRTRAPMWGQVFARRMQKRLAFPSKAFR